MSDRMKINNKQKKAFENAFETYDSDKELTLEEQSQIRYADDPNAKREEIWGKKSSWDKLKRNMKSATYGGDKAKK